jgi:hypothetical protein
MRNDISKNEEISILIERISSLVEIMVTSGVAEHNLAYVNSLLVSLENLKRLLKA